MSLKLLAPSFFNRIRRTVSNIGTGSGVLNVGCGDGEYDLLLSSRFLSTFGVDINKRDIFGANAKKADNNNFVVGDGGTLPFKGSSFDNVVCVDVIEHVENDGCLVREISRVTMKGGTLVLCVPNQNYPLSYDPINWLLWKLAKKHVKIGMWGFGHLRLYTREEVEDLLRSSGLEIVKVEYLNHYLSGLFENYLSSIFSGLLKTRSRRTVRRKKMHGTKNGLPSAVEKIMEKILTADEELFGGSKTSIGMLFKAVKK